MPSIGHRGFAVALATLAVSAEARADNSLWLALPDHPEPCTFERFSAALASLRPDLLPKAGQAPTPTALSASVRREGTAWSLSVLAPGEEPLKRALPDPGKTCEPTSEAAAFMVGRYLQDLQWRETVPLPPLSNLATEPAIAARWQAVTQAAVEGTLGQTGIDAAFELDVGLRRGPWDFGLAGAIALPGRFVALSDDSYHDTFQTEAVRFELPVGRRLLTVGPGDLRLDFTPGIELDWTSDVSYAPASRGLTSRGVAGARLGWEMGFGQRLALALRLEGRLLLGPQPGAPAQDDHDADDPALLAVDCGLSLAVSYLVF